MLTWAAALGWVEEELIEELVDNFKLGLRLLSLR